MAGKDQPARMIGPAPISGNDLVAIEEIWLQACPSCDAGLPYGCTHPGRDYRPVIAALVDEIEVLRAAVQHSLTNSTTPASKDRP